MVNAMFSSALAVLLCAVAVCHAHGNGHYGQSNKYHSSSDYDHASQVSTSYGNHDEVAADWWNGPQGEAKYHPHSKPQGNNSNPPTPAATTAAPATAAPVSPQYSGGNIHEPAHYRSGIPAPLNSYCAPPIKDKGPRAPKWSDHPAVRAKPDMVPAILAWFHTRNSASNGGEELYYGGRFTPRGSRFRLLGSKYQDSPDRYMYWDLLELSPHGALRDDWLEFETTRESKMCIVYGVNGNGIGNHDATMSVSPGYNGVGVVITPDDADLPEDKKYAEYHNRPISWGYLGCKTLPAGTHKMPHKDMLQAGHSLWGYNIIFGEPDGSAPELPEKPSSYQGPDIVPGKRCPDELHDLWIVENYDHGEPAIPDGRKFRTWHPQVDPIYKCHYGHEHGSPGILAGYTERFDYTALKNDFQDESHIGFKGYVIPVNNQYLYMNVHADTRRMGRIEELTHTVVVAITDKGGDLKMELNCKARFGGSFAEYDDQHRPGFPNMQVLPVGSDKNRRLLEEIFSEKNYYSRRVQGKRLNVLNQDYMDYRLKYETNHLTLGLYEKWIGGGNGQMCFKTEEPYREDGFMLDIKDPDFGCKTVECNEPVEMGEKRPDQEYFYPSRGLNRELSFRNIEFAPEHCGFGIPEPGKRNNGVFYTDPECTTVLDGPGPNAVRQYMVDGFKLNIEGAYAVNDIHGTHYYERQRSNLDDFSDEKKSLRGFKNLDGGMAMN